MHKWQVGERGWSAPASFCEKLSASRGDGEDQTAGDQHLKEQDSYTTSLYWDTVLVEEYIYLSIHTEIRLS